MNKVLYSALALGLAATSCADYSPTCASWSGWTVFTGEDTYNRPRHTSYPIWQMFDGNPKTAWVDGGSFGQLDEPTKARPFKGRYTISLVPDKPTVIDELRVMNGYNKNAGTFARNARITRILVKEVRDYPLNEVRVVGTYNLPDKMGEHSIRIPARRYRGLRIDVLAINKGTDPDVAISELQLFAKGKAVGPSKPKYVVFTNGSDCGCGTQFELRMAGGKVIAKAVMEVGSIAASADGRYFAGVGPEYENAELWIFDASSARFVLRKPVPQERVSDYRFPFWTADERLLEFKPGTFGKEVPNVLWRAPRGR